MPQEYRFVTYMRFHKKRFKIKCYFETLTREQRFNYKCYIYKQLAIDESFKNIIWRYLNDDMNEITIRHIKEEEKEIDYSEEEYW